MKVTFIAPFLPAHALPRCAATGIVPMRRPETGFLASLPPPKPGGKANGPGSASQDVVNGPLPLPYKTGDAHCSHPQTAGWRLPLFLAVEGLVVGWRDRAAGVFDRREEGIVGPVQLVGQGPVRGVLLNRLV